MRVQGQTLVLSAMVSIRDYRIFPGDDFLVSLHSFVVQSLRPLERVPFS